MKKLKVIIVGLFIILISLISFKGVFIHVNGVWNNIVPDYKYGMDIEGARELKYTVDHSQEEKYVYVDENGNVVGEVWKDGKNITAEDEASSTEEGQATDEEEISYSKETKTIKVNSEDKLTKENFEKNKKIILKRLKDQNISEYNLRIDDVNEKITIETANNDENVHLIESLIEQPGKFKIVDYQNGLILMDNLDIKNVSVVSSNNDMNYNTYLQIEFNKEGTEKLKNISTKYVQTEVEEESEEEAEEAEEEEHEHNIKYISIMFDDTTMMTTYFGEEMSNGILQIPAGQETDDYSEFVKNYDSAQVIADILNSGTLPIQYVIETDNFVNSEIKDKISCIKLVATIIVAIISIIFIIKYKLKGLLGALLSIGYIAILSLIVRYTNVVITKNSMIAFGIVTLINYGFMKIILDSLKNQKMEKVYIQSLKRFCIALIPVYVATIVFTFSTYTAINSVGTMLFWGVLLNLVYNSIFTRTILK